MVNIFRGKVGKNKCLTLLRKTAETRIVKDEKKAYTFKRMPVVEFDIAYYFRKNKGLNVAERQSYFLI